MSAPFLRLDQDAVMHACSPREWIEALRGGLAVKDVHAPPRGHHGIGAGMLLIMPAWRDGDVIAVKLATVMPHNLGKGLPAIQGEVILFCAQTGTVLASLDGAALTRMRTAAVAALAVDSFARADASDLMLIGTGALAPHILCMLHEVRPRARLRVWGRSKDKVNDLVGHSCRTGFDVQAAHDLDDDLRRSQAIVSATASTTPIIGAHALGQETTLVLMGGFTPAMQEAEPECFRDARIIIDDRDALASGDLAYPIRAGLLSVTDVELFEDALRVGHDGQSKIIFKSVGRSSFDLLSARMVFRRLSMQLDHIGP